MNEQDVIVVGGGPVGMTVAARVRAAHLTVTLIEAELVGGECHYWACVPSKALLRPVEIYDAARSAAATRSALTGQLDLPEVSARRDRFADYWDDTRLVERVAAAGTTVLHGYGRLTGEHAVSVTTADGKAFELTARHAVVLATGNRQAWPDIDGLAVSEPWTNREATAASDVPECLLVLGGGAVGCELATAWTAFGSRVTLVQREAATARDGASRGRGSGGRAARAAPKSGSA